MLACHANAELDGYCAKHHPVRVLAELQAKLEKRFEEAEKRDDPTIWERYYKLEIKERELIREVEKLHKGRTPARCGKSA